MIVVLKHFWTQHTVLFSIVSDTKPNNTNGGKQSTQITIRLRVVWVGLKYLLSSMDDALNFSEHSKSSLSIFSDIGIDRPSLFDYKACTWVLWKMTFITTQKMKANLRLIDTERVGNWKEKNGKYRQFMATVNIFAWTVKKQTANAFYYSLS